MTEQLQERTIAVQKQGRLTLESLEWLNCATGSVFPANERPFDQTRELYDAATGIRVLGFSNGSMYQGVASGLADYGIGGSDKFYEAVSVPRDSVRPKELPLRKVLDLGFAACSLVVAMPRADLGRQISRVVTSYPKLSEDFFASLLPAREVTIDSYSGGIEMIARRGGYDALVDITESGDSLYKNGMDIVATLLECQAVLFRATTNSEQADHSPIQATDIDQASARLVV